VSTFGIIVSVGALIDTLVTRTPLVQRCRSMPVVASGGPGRLGTASVDLNEAAPAMSGSRP
jgi:hypothetical protein